MGFEFDVQGTVQDENYEGDGTTKTTKRAFRMRSRDTRDNKSRKHLQVKDFSNIVSDETVWVWDFDGVPFKVCSSSQTTYIIAKHKVSGEESRHNGTDEFRGRSKVPPAKSWLGRKNLELKANGLEPYTVDDFEITKHRELKSGESFETIIDKLEAYIDDVTKQFNVTNFLFCLGSGDVFRHDLPLPAPYKGQRDPVKPLFLTEARQWVEDNLPCEIAPEGFECDDLVEWYAARGYKDYLKSGKFSYTLLAEDKDSDSNPKLVANYSRAGVEFTAPVPMLIPDSSTDVGCVELVPMKGGNKLVGSGLKWLCMQAFAVGDSADHYHPYNYLPDSYKAQIKYGATEAYTEFLNLSTPQSVLQKSVDNFYKWFPRGLQYIDCHGVEQDMDTLDYMKMMFTVAYMTRSKEDKTGLEDLLKHFKVRYEELKGNNKLDERDLASDDNIVATVKTLRVGLEGLVGKNSLTNYKTSDGKAALQERLKEVEEKVLSMQELLENFFQ